MKKLFLLGAFIYLAVSLFNQAYCVSLVINYKGLDKVHLQYSLSLPGDVTQADLVVESAGITKTIKSSQTPISGELSTTFAPYSTNIFRIIVTHQPPDEPAYKETVEEKTVDLNNQIWGTLLFSETVIGSVLKPQDNISVGGGLVVPAGLSLTFDNARLFSPGISG